MTSNGCSLQSSNPRDAVPPTQLDVPWRIPAALIGTQRLYRVQYQDPDDKLSFRLTLYLQDSETFRLEASDGIGRKVFSLAVAGPALTYVDHRNRTFCQTSDTEPLSGLPFVVFPPRALSRVILGVLPVDPVTELAQNSDAVSFRDTDGRLVSAGLLPEGGLAWWSVAVGGEPIVWWQKLKAENIFSDRVNQQQVRWVELVAEPLRTLPPQLEKAEGYLLTSCSPDSLS